MTDPLSTSYSAGKNYKWSPKNRKKTRMSAFTYLIQHSTGSPSHSNQARWRKKGILIRLEVVKLSVFADDIILDIENPKDSTKNY